MGNSISKQFLQSVEDRLLASIEIPSKHLEGNAYDTRPSDVISLHTYVRSYASSCASRLAHVVVMAAAHRLRADPNDMETKMKQTIVDAIAGESNFIKSCDDKIARGEDTKGFVVRDDQDLQVENVAAANAAVDSVLEKCNDDHAASVYVDSVLEKCNDDHAASVYVHEEWKKRYPRNVALQVEFDKLSREEQEKDTRQVWIARRYIEKPYVWDTIADRVILSSSPSKIAAEEHKHFAEEVVKWTQQICEKRIGIAELWKAQDALRDTIQALFLKSWERVKDDPAIKRRFRPRTFLEHLVKQIAILETEATLTVIHKRMNEAFLFDPKSSFLKERPAMFTIVKNRIAEFKELVPHLRSVALMDAATRQSLLVSRTITTQKEKDARHGVVKPIKTAFERIAHDSNGSDARSFVASFFSQIPKNETDREPFDVAKNTTMLSEALYEAFDLRNGSSACQGREDADLLAERLLMMVEIPQVAETEGRNSPNPQMTDEVEDLFTERIAPKEKVLIRPNS